MSKPCIASNVDGIPEVVQDGVNGILVEPKNSDSLKTAIIKLYENRQLGIDMGIKGREIVLKKFEAGIMAKKIENLYIELLKDKKTTTK
jgi:glycosyltransferase involved in cell wall biosynthesis